jgi:hypothetical protein
MKYTFKYDIIITSSVFLHQQLGFKAACLQIHANFHEYFQNLLPSKILSSQQQKLFTLKKQHLKSTKITKIRSDYAKIALNVLVTQ